MLGFFRKYQRYFFIVIAIVIVISFSFFGTHQALDTSQAEEDHLIGHAIDGSKMMESEINDMARFLCSDCYDLTLSEKGILPNFFNNGVIRKDILKSGVGVLLVEAYFDELKEDLTERMQRHQQFRPYAHPSVPFVSVENLWAQVLPTQKDNLQKFLYETEEMNVETFNLLVDLYLGEMSFPPNVLREYLMFQQKHYNWIKPDPELPRANLNLFQCRVIEDWFGPRFLKLTTQFLTNAAIESEKRGYKVSLEEARVDLIRNGYESLQVQKHNGEVSEEEIGALWREQLFRLQMNEKTAVNIWRKVMLFRRLFEDVGHAVFVDPHVYQTFHGFASKTAEVDLYHLPDNLEIKDFKSMMQLELYLDAVTEGKRDSLMLPKNLATVSKVEKSCPELVEQRFLVEVSQVQKETVGLNVSMKEMWDWQLEEENFQILAKQFPLLSLKKAVDAEGFFEVLEGLDPETRQKVDRFSRLQIVDLHPDWLQHALDQAHLNVRIVSFSSSGKYLPFEGLASSDELLKLFEQTALKQELEVNPQALQARKKLEMFTSDGETYYRFHVLDRDLNKAILTYVEAKERGVLEDLMREHLGREYIQIRESSAALFKDEYNAWKPLDKVINEVGRLVYSDHLKTIENDAQQRGVVLPNDRHENLDRFYPQHRLYSYVRAAHKDIKRLRGESSFLMKPLNLSDEESLSTKPPLNEQWGLVKESQVFKNHEKNPWFHSDIFSMVEQSWSDVGLRASGRLSFFQLKEKKVPSGNFSSEMQEGQEILYREATRLLTVELLGSLKETEAIHLDDGA